MGARGERTEKEEARLAPGFSSLIVERSRPRLRTLLRVRGQTLFLQCLLQQASVRIVFLLLDHRRGRNLVSRFQMQQSHALG
jgi:hypothetical protein